MRAARAEDNCVPPGLRLNDNKEVDNGQGEEDECGGSIVRDTLGSLVGNVDMLKLLGELVVARELL